MYFVEALSIHMPSMCYTVQLEDGYRLLALNDDHGNEHAGFTNDCFEWIKEQIELAHKDNQFIVAMTHHPILTPSPLYKIIAPTNVVENGVETAKKFADMGIPCIFTGHSHVHNITSVTSESGNIIYDVSTSSVVGFPPYYRHAVFKPNIKQISVTSTLVENVPSLETDGISLSAYIEKLFLGVVEDILNSAENDYETFQNLAIGFSLEKNMSKKLKPIIQPIAKYLNHLTFGRVWKLTKRRSKVTKQEIAEIKNKKVVPFAIDMVANLYRGDANLDATSVEYRVAVGFFEFVEKLSKPFAKKLKALGIESITSVVLPLLHKDGISDSNAELKY